MSKATLLIEAMKMIRHQPGITVSELSDELGRCERTIYRWLSEMSSDLDTSVSCIDGGYHIKDNDYTNGPNLNARELLAVRLSLRSPAFRSDSPLFQAAESAWVKIRSASPDAELQNVDRLTESHVVGANPPPSEVSLDIAEALEQATSSRRAIRISYRSQGSNEPHIYTFKPYAIAFRRNNWYVVGHSNRQGKVVTLKMARVHSVMDTGKDFEVPMSFSIDNYFKNAWEVWRGEEPVTVRIRFAHKLATLMSETKRHPTQTIYPQPDGSIIFEVIVSGFGEIGAWIIGYGGDAEVLEPESLRNHIIDQARSITARYAQSTHEQP